MAEFEVTAAAVRRHYHIQVIFLASCSNCKFFGIFFSLSARSLALLVTETGYQLVFAKRPPAVIGFV